jgi:hypothetical protein
MLRIESQAINAGRRGVAVPAQFVAALLVPAAELFGEAVAAEFRTLGKRPIAAVHQDGVELADNLFKASRGNPTGSAGSEKMGRVVLLAGGAPVAVRPLRGVAPKRDRPS